MMLDPVSDLAILLKAMGEYQDRRRVESAHPSHPTHVCLDWAFHEERTGFDRIKISSLLPQLVAAGLADHIGGHTTGRKVAPKGRRPEDGYAWISDQGQFVLSQMQQPPPPIQVIIDSLSLQTRLQLIDVFEKASELGVSKADIRRLEELLEDIASSSEADRMEKASNLVQFFAGSKDLTLFFMVAVLPFLRGIAGA